MTSGTGPGSIPAGLRPFHLGLDVAMKAGNACLLDPLGQKVVPQWTFHNNRPGAEVLVAKVAQLLESHGATSLVVGMEATGIYGWHLACFLSEAPQLRPWAARVFVFNPHRTLSFKKALGSTEKTDRVDAGAVAQWLGAVFMPMEHGRSCYLALSKLAPMLGLAWRGLSRCP